MGDYTNALLRIATALERIAQLDKPPLTSSHTSEIPERGERLSETLARVFKLWNQARGELDAANQHVKILTADRNQLGEVLAQINHNLDSVAASLSKIAIAQSWLSGTLDKPPLTSPHPSEISERGNGPLRDAALYMLEALREVPAWFEEWNVGIGAAEETLLGRVNAAIEKAEATIPAGGPPTPDLAAQPDSTTDRSGTTVPPDSESALRGKWRVGSKVPLNVYDGDRPVCQCHSFMDALEIVNAMNAMAQPAGGPPTPDPDAQPNSTTDLPPYDPTTGTGFHQHIGVFDYDSLVGCLRSNWEMISGHKVAPETDPQDMIQQMAATIQTLRRKVHGDI